MSEGLNLFKQPYSDASVISRTDTDFYLPDAIPDNSKDTIQFKGISKSEVDFIDFISTEILMNLRIQNKADNTVLGEDMSVAKYGLCNNFGNVMCRQITIQEGDVEMNPSTGCTPIKLSLRICYNITRESWKVEQDLRGISPTQQFQLQWQKHMPIIMIIKD